MSSPALIILGASARAAAQSAKRAGYEPWCIDRFADRDLQAIATVRACPAGAYPFAMLKLLEEAPPGPVLLTGAMENHLDVVDAIAMQRNIMGPSPAAMRAARDPRTLTSLHAVEGLRLPVVHDGPTWRLRLRTALPRAGRYLMKPRRGANGAGIEPWAGWQPFREDCYVQQFIDGTPISAVFRADGWSAKLLGASEQLIGDPAFGAAGFGYCGSLCPADLPPQSFAALSHLGVALTQTCDMRGLFGVDAILDAAGDIWPVEVNPRYVASVEVIERATGVAALDSPADATAQPNRPRAAATTTRPRGKAYVFAQSPGRVRDLLDLLGEDAIADVPAVGAPIEPGQPICTVFATAPTRDACLDQLRQHAHIIYTRGLDG